MSTPFPAFFKFFKIFPACAIRRGLLFCPFWAQKKGVISTSNNRYRPDQDGTHRLAFERNKKKIYATQTVCGICARPVDFSLKYPHPMGPCI